MAVITLTTENFEQEVLKSDLPVLVDFWAPWCGPCSMVTPIIDEIAGEVQGTAKVGKVNVDEQGELASQYGVMGIPTICIFKNGEVAQTSVGVKSKAELLALLD